jgi:uncharacterized protein (DUF58 family)
MTSPANAQRPELLDPAQLHALGGLEIRARWVVEGFLTGLHRSRKKGFSVEFAEHRAYQPGDDLRYMDWKMAARADKWLIKLFEEETNLRATVVLDVSKSMDWSGSPQRLTKLAYAETLVAAISLLLLKQRDAVGLIRFDDEVRTVLPPRSRDVHFRRILAALSEPGAGLGSDAPGALMRAARLVPRPGMVIVVSDLLMDPEETVHAVQVLRGAGHQVTVLHLLDPAERDLSVQGAELVFVDPETGAELEATVGDVRAAYRETVLHAMDEWRSMLAGAGASYEPIFTDSPFAIPVRRAFLSRRRLP